MKTRYKFFAKSFYSLVLAVLVSTTAIFAWFRLIYPVKGSSHFGVIDGSNVTMEVDLSSDDEQTSGDFDFHAMIPGNEYVLTIRFKNSANYPVTFDLVFFEVEADVFDYVNSEDVVVYSGLSLLNVFAASFDFEDVDNGSGGISRSYYSLNHLFLETNGVSFSETTQGLDIKLLKDFEIEANGVLDVILRVRFIEGVYGEDNNVINTPRIPMNTFQKRAINISVLKIVEQEEDEG